MSETMLKQDIIRLLKDDFDIVEEVAGHHPIYDLGVRIDFMLRAKAHLVQAGFTSDWFGIECKWVEGLNGQTAKVTKLFWQSITYAQSVFRINNEKVTPRFIAIFRPDRLEPQIDNHFKSLSQLGLYAKVGELIFYRDRSWGIKFTYLYARKSDGNFMINESKLPKTRAGMIS